MKKVVLRKCVASNQVFPKEDLIRIVKNKEGNVFIDKSKKANGRGAYLSKSIDAIELARKKHLLDKALEAKVSDDIYQELLTIIKEENK